MEGKVPNGSEYRKAVNEVEPKSGGLAQTSFTSEEKLRWEIEKLRAETSNLKKPYIKTPASWTTILTIILALFGILIQYYRSDREYQLAEIKKQQTILDTQRLVADRQQLEQSIAGIQNTLLELQHRHDEVTDNLAALESRANDLKEKTSSQEAKQLVQEVNRSINNIRSLNETAADQIEALGNDLDSPRLPAFAVVASFPNLELALAYARSLQARNLSFPVEVYRRSPNRFQVTLGGYLTYEEAEKRVSYAKEQRIASDAYVRQAKGWGDNLFTQK
jgi:DNA repair exonuclease SbcCD ATPase subunit